MPRGRSYARKTKRLSTWLDVPFSTTTMTAAGGTIIASLNAAALAIRPFTIVRTHLEAQVFSDQSAAIERQACAVGLAVVSDQAAAIGVTAVPTPVTDLGSDFWFVHQVMFATEGTLTDRTTPGTQYSIDSKAMRKVEGDSDLVVVGEFSALGGGVRLFLAGRILIKTN